MSNKSAADLRVLEALVTLLQGFRFSPDPELVRAAAEREVKLMPEFRRLTEIASRQSELFDRDDLALAASAQPED